MAKKKTKGSKNKTFKNTVKSVVTETTPEEVVIKPKKKMNRREVIQKMKLNNAIYLPGKEVSLPADISLPKTFAKLLTSK